MNKFFFTVTIFVILVLSGLFAAPYIVDWKNYRHVLEAGASKAVGRDVKVAGDVDMRFLPTPYVRFGDVTIAGAEGEADKPFLTTKNFTMWLSITPLLKGTLSASDIEIDGANLNLTFKEDGTPTWSNLGNAEERFPFMPANVQLDHVDIKNSSIAIHPATATAPLVLENINGVLSAKDLGGPYKFSGNWTNNAVARDIRLTTSALDSGGAMKVKALIRHQASGASYNLDSEAVFNDGVPELAGTLTATVPPLLQNSTQSNGTDPQTKSEPEFVEIKSGLDLNIRRALFSNIVLSYERQSRPQTINGEAIVDWNKGINLTGRIGAKLLDLDQILGGGQGRSKPTEVLKLLRNLIHETSPFVTKAAIRALVEQASLGGELVQSVDMQLSKTGDAFEISSLKAELPGKNTVELAGKLHAHTEQLGFSGPISLAGENLPRLVNWLQQGDKQAARRGVSRYELKGLAELSPGSFSLQKVQGDFSGNTLTGNFTYAFDNQKALTIALDSNQLDLKKIFGPNASLEEIDKWIKSSNDKKTAKSTFLGIPSDLKTNINVRIGEAKLQDFEAKNLLINAQYADNELIVRNLAISSEGGMFVSANGSLKENKNSRSGTLKMHVKAREPEGLSAVYKFVNLLQTVNVPQPNDMNALVPLRLDATLTSGAKGTKGSEARIEGQAAGIGVAMRATFDEGFANVDASNLAVEGALGTKDVRKLLSLVLGVANGNIKAADLSGKKLSKGVLSFSATGTPNKALRASLALKSKDISGTYEGAIRVEDDATSADGALTLKMEPTKELLLALGMASTPLKSNSLAPLSFKGKLQKDAGTYVLSDMSGAWGINKFKGDVKADLTQSPALVDVAIGVSKASLPEMFGFLMEDQARAKPTKSKKKAKDPYWNNASFARNALQDITGEVRLGIGLLEVGPNIPIQKAGLVANIKDGKADLALVSGSLYGGEITSDLSLNSDGVGLKVNGGVEIKGANLENLTAANTGKPLAKGPFNGILRFSGQGLSPRGLVSVLKGQGSITLGKGEIYELSPRAIPLIVGEGAGKEYEDKISTLLNERFKEASFPLNATKFSLKLAHGQVRSGLVPLANDETTLRVRSSLDLASLKLRSEWALTAAKSGKRKASPPPVELGFFGPLDKFGAIKPIVDTKQLERFITVERMERDVERLEEMERQDRERARKLEKLRKEREAAARKERLRKERERAAREEQMRKELERLRKFEQEQLSQPPIVPAPAITSEPLPPTNLAPAATRNGTSRNLDETRPASLQGGANPTVDAAPLDGTLLPSREINPPADSPIVNEQPAATQADPQSLGQETLDTEALAPDADTAEQPVVRRQVRKKKDKAPDVFNNPLNPFAN